MVLAVIVNGVVEILVDLVLLLPVGIVPGRESPEPGMVCIMVYNMRYTLVCIMVYYMVYILL